MSITIFIENDSNRECQNECYCDKDSDCSYCHGTGFTYSSIYELNMANRNFGSFWSALGFDYEYCGRIHPAKVQRALVSFNPSLGIRAGGRDGNMIECGLELEQIERYVDRLRKIVDQAFKTEQMIVWG